VGDMGKAIDATLFAVASGTDECESNVRNVHPTRRVNEATE